MDMSEYKGFKLPLPCKGTVEVQIVKMEEIKGNKEDSNGDVSEGLKFAYRIVGPDGVCLNDADRSTAIGFEFEEILWKPRRSLMDKDSRTANRMKADIARQLSAVFGENADLSNITPRDFEGRNLKVQIDSKFDSYAGEDIVVVYKREAL